MSGDILHHSRSPTNNPSQSSGMNHALEKEIIFFLLLLFKKLHHFNFSLFPVLIRLLFRGSVIFFTVFKLYGNLNSVLMKL